MRDPARIQPILDALGRAWQASPDLRLGQLLSCITVNADPFYIEDDEILKLIQQTIMSFERQRSSV